LVEITDGYGGYGRLLLAACLLDDDENDDDVY
jgi:hypothetical protein